MISSELLAIYSIYVLQMQEDIRLYLLISIVKDFKQRQVRIKNRIENDGLSIVN